MRVLIVDAYPTSSKSGRERFARFRRLVLRVLDELQRSDVTRIELVERHRSALDDFLYELRSEFADPAAISRFDQLDFVFVDGDGSSSPWAPGARKLALLAKMCLMTGKCMFAAGLGAALLAYVCATGGELLRVLNQSGKGGLLDSVAGVPPPAAADAGAGVLLDTKTGDYFSFSPRDRSWVPKGNTGLVLHSSDAAKAFYGARPNSARAGGAAKPTVAHAALYLARRGEERCCARLEAVKSHTVLRAALGVDGAAAEARDSSAAVAPAAGSRELVLRCTSRWDIDEEISSTSANRFRVLVDSARGPMLLEFGNCLGAHFELDARAYPASAELLRQFVRAKAEEIKTFAHVDRSFVAAISGGNARLRERLVLAQSKRGARPVSAGGAATATATGKHTPAAGDHGAAAGGAAGMSPGRTSPKRCRPLSAGPQRSASKASVPVRTIQTSRSVYPSASVSVSASTSAPGVAPSRAGGNNGPFEEPTDGSRPTREGWKGRSARPETEDWPGGQPADPSSNNSGQCEEDALARPPPKPRVVRVPQQHEREKPYCAFARRHEEQQPPAPRHGHSAAADGYYSVVNDAPYTSAFEREMLEHQRSKLKWVAGPFRTVVGKASTQVAPEAGLFARGPFVQKNVPHYIIQRRTLEPQESKPAAPHRTRPQLERKHSGRQVPRSPANNRRR